jgi:TetR/AcrR family transcriptional regulator
VDSNKETIEGTEERILAAARKVFFKQGYGGARMQEIADEAGINKAMLHYYFRSKDKLFEQVFREAFGRLLPSLADIFSQPVSIFEKIEQFTQAYISIVTEHPYLPVFVLSEMHRNPDEFFNNFVHPDMVDNIRNIGQQFYEAVKQGTIRPIDPRQLMVNVMSLCVFPFIARPMLQRLMQIPDADYQLMLEKRKQEVSRFVIQAIQPDK